MSKYISIVIFLLFLNSAAYGKETYNFVSMKNIIIEDVGKIIVPKIFEKINIKLNVTPMPAKRAENEVFTGKKDGEVMRIWSYLKSNPNTIRVPTSYYDLKTTAFVRSDSNIKIDSVEDLKNYKLVKQFGVKHTNNITLKIKNVVDVNSKEALMSFLQSNRAEVALTSSLDGDFTLKKLNINDIIKIQKPLAKFKVYIYIHKKYESLVPKVDAAIKQMKESKELEEIIKLAEQEVLKNYLAK